MKLKILAVLLTAAALPVLAQTSTSAPVEPRQARVEVNDTAKAGDTAVKPKAAKTSKSSKSTKTAKKTAKKKGKKPQTAG